MSGIEYMSLFRIRTITTFVSFVSMKQNDAPFIGRGPKGPAIPPYHSMPNGLEVKYIQICIGYLIDFLSG